MADSIMAFWESWRAGEFRSFSVQKAEATEQEASKIEYQSKAEGLEAFWREACVTQC